MTETNKIRECFPVNKLTLIIREYYDGRNARGYHRHACNKK